MGATVIEVKKSLRKRSELDDAAQQLAGYVEDRSAVSSQRYSGIVTDGLDWPLYSLDGDELAKVDSFSLSNEAPRAAALTEWLGGVLATRRRFGLRAPLSTRGWVRRAQPTRLN